ncbi:ABC-type transport auxiliary lipoprotein family protein [Rhodobacteraceae bacterium DSL-40]|uniref:ABC-type transport auxiliary lipoprotein family protein n=1 Tax=Amaricoccus sp. B4 TaxID=3368557 RepID=UPI000DAD8C50
MRLTSSPLAIALLALGGCSTISSLDSASRSLDTYELTAVEAAGPAARSGGPTLAVSAPTSSGAIASDRIVIKPDALQVAFLGDGRWVDPAPVLIQQLLTRSLSSTGRFGLVTTNSTGPLPDHTLVVDIEAFQAEIAPEGAPAPVHVVVRLSVTVLNEGDGRVAARRRFEADARASDDSAAVIVPAFDTATERVLREVVAWAASAARV